MMAATSGEGLVPLVLGNRAVGGGLERADKKKLAGLSCAI